MKIVALLLLVVTCACSRSAPSCARLEPSFVPSGMRAVKSASLVTSGWSRTWRSRARMIQIDGGVSANLGEDTKHAIVRGRDALYGPTGIDVAPLAVQWTEGSCTYAVLGNGFSGAELLRVANGLRPA